jgi:hypothetical protein
MYEDIGKIIGKGYSTWRNNLNLCIPFVLDVLAAIAALIPMLAALVFTIGLNASNSGATGDLNQMLGGSLLAIALGALISFVLMILVSSFFVAGAVAMARQATDEGKTSTEIMWSAGRKHFVNMSAATLLTMLISLAGILLLVPGVLSLPTESLSNPEMLANAGETTIALFIAGAVLIVIYELAVSLLLAMVPYSLVIDDLGPRDAIRASIRFFRYNKFDVFMVWVISLALSIALQIAGSAFSTTGAEPSALVSVLTTVINLLVLAPLSTVWWTRLCLDRTGKLKVESAQEWQ